MRSPLPLRRLARFAALLAVLLGATVAGGGCTQTAMLPAKQLDEGTTAVSATLDEPGVAYVPRVNAQLTQGFGGGDVTVNASYPVPGAGLTGRAYLDENVNAELQLQAARNLEGEDGGSVLALAGLQEAPTGRDSWYLGAQAGMIHGEQWLSFSSPPETQTLPVAGASIGVAPLHDNDNLEIQVELEVNAPLFATGDPPMPASRISIGIYRLFD
jgi:hypothetical protein